MKTGSLQPFAVIAVPVRDEQARIAACVRALAFQDAPAPHEILLLLNNCRDDTAAVVRDLAPSLPVRVHAACRRLPPHRATAGHARSLAMLHAARLVRPGGVLLTTDADGVAHPGWLAENLAALDAGADAVAGRALIDPVEAAAIPPHLHADDARECAYADLLDEITSLLDPDPADPWPRHSEHSGASIAVRLDIFRRAGGVPPVCLGEDRAFFAALRRTDARIRHLPSAMVTVSGRTEGRAVGGMADTMRRRIVCQDPVIDDRLEPARDRQTRARLSAAYKAVRAGRACPGALARKLGLPPASLAACLATNYAGEGWAMLEARSPALRRRLVRRRDLEREISRASLILEGLRQTLPAAAADPAGIAAHAGSIQFPGPVPLSA